MGERRVTLPDGRVWVATYDRDADVLYLAADDGLTAAFTESPEGHPLRLAEDGAVVGVTILGLCAGGPSPVGEGES